ncbi:MAG: hypothetical protein ACK5UE_00155 [Chitinophagales bacterium]|jgi:hypothetical protein|nr:hypothetical protein [Sphingobacteriales bacterium]
MQLAIAQFQVQYNHVNPLKFSLEDFNKVVIISNADQPSVRVRYALLDDKKKKICEVNFQLLPMVKGINKLNYATGELVWHNSPYRDLLIKNQLVSGNFQLCVAVTDLFETMPDADDCFDIELQSIDIQNDLNANPIELQSPAHKDTIDEIRPMLTWIPPSPSYQGTSYQILLVEKKENQTCTEALNNNIPFIHKKDIITNILNYPADVQALEKGHKYCWRASAHKDLKEYSRSEDWEFMVRGEEKNTAFPFIDEIDNKIILFHPNNNKVFIENNLDVKFLDYEIKYNSDNRQAVLSVKKYPIEIAYGRNLIQFNDKLFESNGLYEIRIQLNSKNYIFHIKK